MTTIFQKNRFKLSTNGVVVTDQFSACKEITASTTPPSLPAAAQFPSTATALLPSVAADGSHNTVVTSMTTTTTTEGVGAATTGASVVKSQMRSLNSGAAAAQPDVVEPEIDILINNVVCSFSLGCHLNLRQIALNAHNVEYRRENGMVTMKLRKPQITASVWSSGKITCTGATSEEEALAGARRIARVIQKLGFNAKFRKMRIVNVLGCCSMPFEIKINAFSQRFREADYEPELHPGVTYKLPDLKATLKIFSTGSITVTAPSVPNVQLAIEHIYPLVFEFRKELSAVAEELRSRKRALAAQNHHRHYHHQYPLQQQQQQPQQQQQQQPQQQQQQPQQLQHHQNHHIQVLQPADGNIKRKRLNSNNSGSSNDDEDKEVESIMSS